MDEFIKEFVALLLKNDLTLEYDYDYGWFICRNSPYDTLNLNDVVYKLDLYTRDSDNIIKQKMLDFCAK